jgi:hypothetical protein
MELNKKVTRSGGMVEALVINPEGGIVYPERNDKSLFLTASAFKLRNSFYWKAEDTLRILEELIDENKDFAYKMAVAKFLAEMLGVRLSPVIITAREAMKLKPANLDRWQDDVSVAEARTLLKEVVKSIYDRPDKIANALAYAQYHWDEFRSLPPFYKKALRNALEKFDAYTLRKFKLKKRQVKMADIIKALRPRPRNDDMAELYAAIIENRPEAAIEKDTVITEVLSDVTKTKKEKREWVAKNISKIPLNALIRNLRNVPQTRDNAKLLYRRLQKALRIEAGLPVVKVANPFDILTAGLNSGYELFIGAADLALEEFLSEVELVDTGTNISILVDVSGSMSSGWMGNRYGGIDVAGDYMALLMPTLRNANVNLYAFNTQIEDKSDRVALYKRNSPVTIRELFLKDFVVDGGTALAQSVREVANKDNPDLLIVLSDEVSWADADGANRVFDVGCSVIAINPYPQGRFTVFAPHLPVIKVSALDAKIFYYIPMMTNFKSFKKWIKNWAFGR